MTLVAPKHPPQAAASANPKPPGWGADELMAFIEAAHHNQYATFFQKRAAMRMLVSIDAEFAKVTKGWVNPASEILAMLFIRCHGAFRAAAGLAMAGQAAETYVQCRAMLEYAAYAVHIHRDPPLGMVWLDRHQSSRQGHFAPSRHPSGDRCRPPRLAQRAQGQRLSYRAGRSGRVLRDRNGEQAESSDSDLNAAKRADDRRRRESRRAAALAASGGEHRPRPQRAASSGCLGLRARRRRERGHHQRSLAGAGGSDEASACKNASAGSPQT
jgi:hypothetical protein